MQTEFFHKSVIKLNSKNSYVRSHLFYIFTIFQQRFQKAMNQLPCCQTILLRHRCLSHNYKSFTGLGWGSGSIDQPVSARFWPDVKYGLQQR